MGCSELQSCRASGDTGRGGVSGTRGLHPPAGVSRLPLPSRSVASPSKRHRPGHRAPGAGGPAASPPPARAALGLTSHPGAGFPGRAAASLCFVPERKGERGRGRGAGRGSRGRRGDREGARGRPGGGGGGGQRTSTSGGRGGRRRHGGRGAAQRGCPAAGASWAESRPPSAAPGILRARRSAAGGSRSPPLLFIPDLCAPPRLPVRPGPQTQVS